MFKRVFADSDDAIGAKMPVRRFALTSNLAISGNGAMDRLYCDRKEQAAD